MMFHDTPQTVLRKEKTLDGSDGDYDSGLGSMLSSGSGGSASCPDNTVTKCGITNITRKEEIVTIPKHNKDSTPNQPINQFTVPNCYSRLCEQDADGDTIFIVTIACGLPQEKAALELINQATPRDLNIQNRHGQSACHIAAYVGSPVIIRSLIDHFANMCLVDGNGQTPMHLLASKGHSQCIREWFTETPGMDKKLKRMLVAPLALRDHNGYTPLQLAVINNHREVVTLLCSICACSRVKIATNGYEAIHLAAERSYADLIQILVEVGKAALDAAAYNGVTALHIAAGMNDSTTVAALLDLGADPNIQSWEGYLPSDLSTDKNITKKLKELVNGQCQ